MDTDQREPSDPYLCTEGLSADTLLRWSGGLLPIPLPSHMCPTGGAPLEPVPEAALMSVIPQMIAHVQRTAAQGGLQVVSPRQIPFCKSMIRTFGGKRLVGDHVVGSVADVSSTWPTIDGDDLSGLLPDEPLPNPYVEHTVQTKTKTIPLTKAGKLLSDPILSCLIKGRAVVDILRRDDVAGDADGVLQLLASAWGVPFESLAELDAYSLGIEGSLLRHAIKSDEVYPMMYAPIHVRKVVSMGASEIDRTLLPDDTAMDWKRSRVFCEAVFTLAMSIEGHKLTDVATSPPPGDPGAPSDRPGVLVFQPAPGSAWSFAPRTFSIYPSRVVSPKKMRGIPREVLTALTKYVNLVRPVSHALVAGHRAVAKKSTAVPSAEIPLETISEGYVLMIRSMMVGGARGRSSAAAVRNVIYMAMENSPMDVRLRLARYFKLAREEARIHLGVLDVPDTMIVRLANKFPLLGEKVRHAVVAEAARRGATAEEWWADILAQAPNRYACFAEGTHGWTRVALWLLFKGPTDKWERLLSAVSASAMRAAAVASVGQVRLPAKKGSVERLLAASRHTVKEVTRVYAAHYIGVADVGLAISDELELKGRPRSASTLKEAAYLWMLRARCYRGANVVPVAHEEELRSDLHYRVPSEPVDLALAPAPYRAFQAYVNHVESCDLISTEVKRKLKDYRDPPLTQVFSEIRRPILPAPVSTVTRYLLNPPQLAMDIERSWEELVVDLRKTAAIYGREVTEQDSPPAKRHHTTEFEARVFEATPISKTDYYATLAQLDPDLVDGIEDMVDNLEPIYAESITEREYSSVSELLAFIRDIEMANITSADPSAEVTR